MDVVFGAWLYFRERSRAQLGEGREVQRFERSNIQNSRGRIVWQSADSQARSEQWTNGDTTGKTLARRVNPMGTRNSKVSMTGSKLGDMVIVQAIPAHMALLRKRRVTVPTTPHKFRPDQAVIR